MLFHPSDQVPNWPDDSPFAEPDWKIVPVAGRIYCEKVEGPDSAGWPVRDGLPDIETYLDPLIWCLRKRSCREIVIYTNSRFQPLNPAKKIPQLFCRCEPEIESIKEACEYLHVERDGRELTTHIEEFMAFDESGEWAMIDNIEDFHFLGGTPEFMARYFEAAGGEDYVRAWFYHWDIVGPISYENQDGQPRAYQKTLYDLVGWPYPPYPVGGLFDGDDLDWSPVFGDRIKSGGPGTPDEDWGQ